MWKTLLRVNELYIFQNFMEYSGEGKSKCCDSFKVNIEAYLV